MKIQKKIIKNLIKKRINTPLELDFLKRRMAKKYRTSCHSNIQLLKAYHELLKDKRIKKTAWVERILRTRPVRSLSGIVNVSILTKAFSCPGHCLYCPEEKDIPKGYLSGEPAVERAKSLKYSPFLQTRIRIKSLEKQGHPTDKIDLRIIGGTWSYYPKNYQTKFIASSFAACNTASQKTTKRKIKSLEKEQKLNEKAKHRIIGISVETRPDFINQKEIKRMRVLGITKVELGVQTTDDAILKLNRRGHKIKETIFATKMLKDTGFKVSYQVMPNLPGSSPKKDTKLFKDLFQNQNFKPDMLKIYPCALLKEAPLYKWYLKGRYKPYSKKVLMNVIKKAKKETPRYVRIERIIRDIPAQRVVVGPAKISNLREDIINQIKAEGWRCRCIRCREIRDQYNSKEKLFLFREDYKASDGMEIFLSFEDRERKNLYSLLRLRIPSSIVKQNFTSENQYFLPELRNSSIIREVHTYGQLVSLKKKGVATQHRGLGKKLIQKAENISKKEFNLNKLAIISAIGTREYYKKIGYKLEGTYMTRVLDRHN
jgi:elongator complex protein 3